MSTDTQWSASVEQSARVSIRHVAGRHRHQYDRALAGPREPRDDPSIRRGRSGHEGACIGQDPRTRRQIPTLPAPDSLIDFLKTL